MTSHSEYVTSCVAMKFYFPVFKDYLIEGYKSQILSCDEATVESLRNKFKVLEELNTIIQNETCEE